MLYLHFYCTLSNGCFCKKKKKHSKFKFQKFEMIDEGSHLTDDAPVELKKIYAG